MRFLVRPYPPEERRLSLTGGEVHVWQARLDGCPVPHAALEATLTPGEHARAVRFRLPHVRDQFVRTRALLRVLLGRYLGCPAVAVPIEPNPDGKPVVAGGGVEFNVSHTEGLAVFAVADRPVGVDVEVVREIATMDDLVERFFAPRERELYRSLPAELRRTGFFRGWTCKEAVLKGIGCGTRDLDRCVVDLDPRRTPHIVGPPDIASGWVVESWVPEPGYVAAVALESRKVDSFSDRSAWTVKPH
jgi:4'-phosphopantetheinyl transferase